MNKKLYLVIGFIPFLGKSIQNTISFWHMKGSSFMNEFTKNENYQVLKTWMKENPNKILTNKIAKNLLINR